MLEKFTAEVIELAKSLDFCSTSYKITESDPEKGLVAIISVTPDYPYHTIDVHIRMDDNGVASVSPSNGFYLGSNAEAMYLALWHDAMYVKEKAKQNKM